MRPDLHANRPEDDAARAEGGAVRRDGVPIGLRGVAEKHDAVAEPAIQALLPLNVVRKRATPIRKATGSSRKEFGAIRFPGGPTLRWFAGTRKADMATRQQKK